MLETNGILESAIVEPSYSRTSNRVAKITFVIKLKFRKTIGNRNETEREYEQAV